MAGEVGSHGRCERPGSAIERAVQTGGVPGIVALATGERSPIYSGAFARRDLEWGPVMTLDAVYPGASMAKLVTCVAALRFGEQCKLALDEPPGALLAS
jgi:methyl acetate hydrolase